MSSEIFMMVSGVWNNSSLPQFVKCLESLPNLYTPEIGQADYYPTSLFRSMVVHVELPQIKALILAPNAFPLLRSCRNVEDVVYIFMGGAIFLEELCESLASNRDPESSV